LSQIGTLPQSLHRRLLVRCDVGPAYGVGHLMRCVALSEEFASRGFEVVFSADVETVPFAQEQLRARGFQWLAPPDSTSDLVEQASGADAVVIDSYALPGDAYSAVRRVRATLAIVDGDPVGKDGHVMVDQNIGAESDKWPLPEGTVRLAGLDYALMRDEILSERSGTHAPTGSPVRVFAFFGGTDAFGAAPLLTRAMVATDVPFDLRVVGATQDLLDELSQIKSDPGQRITAIGPTSELASEIRAADVVVSAAGTSSWELLCLGAACAFVCVADNQVVSYDRVTDLGAVAGLGRLERLRTDSSEAVRVLGELLTDEPEQERLRDAGRSLVDGRGRERVADALIGHLRSS
jgi:spore coat polysaccharide biosynthesis predicted glycosyltransferase SpsG